jgi:hypothetical protein
MKVRDKLPSHEGERLRRPRSPEIISLMDRQPRISLPVAVECV